MNPRTAAISALIFITICAMSTIPTFAEYFTPCYVSEEDVISGTKAKTIYEFSMNGSEVAGSVLGGYFQEERPILDGRINGQKISFRIEHRFGNRTISYRYEGAISGDTIKFVVRSGGQKIAEFMATKSD
jgi:hypothetical protein